MPSLASARSPRLRVFIVVTSLFVLSGLILQGCAGEPIASRPVEKKKDYWRPLAPGATALVRVTDPRELPDFRKIEFKDPAILAALDESEAFFRKPSSQKYYPYKTADSEVTHQMQLDTLQTLRRIIMASRTPEEFHGWMTGAFDVFKSVGADEQGAVLFTGYYTPIFDGSLTKDATFKYPLYSRPDDLVTDPDGLPLGRRTPDGRIVPYYTRDEIERGNLMAGRELAYLSDPFEVYIVHVQGSARLRMRDGRFLNLGYAGKTDRPYKSVGMTLIEQGKMTREELSLSRLRRYFKEHPQELDAALGVNESYVFFTKYDESARWPLGSINAKVTPYHTVATDKAIFPRGSFVIPQTSIPSPGSPEKLSFVPHMGIYFDQDTGGAIRAAGRSDIYMGVGPDAEKIAGYTQNEGKLFYLFVKPNPVRP